MADEDRIPCRVCGRKFAAEPLSRHQKICKNIQKPRKAFDSSKQRATDDLSVKQIKQAQKKDIAPPRSHWREKHQDFINAVRSSKGVSQALATGGPLPPPPPPSLNPDYVSCPYCSRRFNEKAASRHIDFCKEQSMRLPKGKADPAAKAKQQTRLNYQAPKLKPKTQPGTPAGRAAPSGRGGAAGPGSRAAPAPRGRSTGIPAAGRYNTQDDDFSAYGQGMYSGMESTPSAYDTSPVTSHRSGYSNNNSYSQRQQQQQHPSGNHNNNNRLKQTRTKQTPISQQKRTPRGSSQTQRNPPSRHHHNTMDDDNGYGDYRDPGGHSDKQLNNFPDHFNKRYKNNTNTNQNYSDSNSNSPVPSYTKNKPPTHFQYLDRIENDGGDGEDDDMFLYSNDPSPPASLYGRSSKAPSNLSVIQMDSHQGNGGESGPQSGSRTKLLLSYCQECGNKYPVTEAKFCSECGTRRPIAKGAGRGDAGGGARYSRLK